MGPRTTRTVVVLAASAALAIATVAPSAAQAASSPPGVGSSEGAASVLEVALGSDALGLRLVGEDSQTSNDTSAGGPSALERLTPLEVTSTLLPALAGLSLPAVETRSTSGEDATTTPAVDLGALAAGSPAPGVLAGTIDPIALRSLVDASGATSAAQGAVHDLAVLGGLLRLDAASADLGSRALVSDAGAARGLRLDGAEVLDLGALLEVLGLSLADLPLDAVVGLLGQLGLPLPAGVGSTAELLATLDGLVAQTGAVRAQVTTLQGQIDDLQGQLAPLAAQLTQATGLVSSLAAQLSAQQALLAACVVPALCAPIQAQITSLTSQLAAAQASAASVDAAINTLQGQIDALVAQIDALLATVSGAVDQLTGLLDGILGTLDGASLLAVDDLVVGVTAMADDTLASSVASVVGSVGDVRIGTQSLGGIDAGSALGQVTALADQVTGTLGTVLSTIDPSLAGLVDVDLFAQSTSLTQSAGVTEAVASVTGLLATVTPPDVCALLGRLDAQGTVGGLLTGLGEQLPALPGPVSSLLDTVGSTVTCTSAAAAAEVLGAITQPLTVRALSVSGTGSFSVPGASGTPTPGGTLPATGGAPLTLLAVVLGVAGYGSRRLLARVS